MILNILSAQSFWKSELKQKHYQIKDRNSKLVVLFPGKNYSCEKPCLHYAGASALQNGFDLLVLEYGYQATRTDLDIKDLPRLIEESEEVIRRIANNYEHIVFISKSLGTIVAGEVDRRLKLPVKHIYLTPIKDTIEYINSSECIVVYGTNDEFFNKAMADTIINRRTIEIPSANHSLETTNVDESIAILKLLVNVYEEVLCKL